jgi:hypothetical protein
MYKKLILIAIVFFTFISCEKTFDPGATSAVKVANEWWVNLYLDGEPLYGSFGKIATYNVSANDNSMWLDDLGNIWNFKCRTNFDATNLTFQATNAVNENYDITVTISDGKIMSKAAKSATGVVTDSIYFKVVFSDDPTTTYEIKGTGRTMWAEDDY